MRRLRWILLLALLGCGGPSRLPEPVSDAVEARSGTRQLIVAPEEGREPIIKAFRGARRSIDLVIYMLTDPQLLDELCQARKRGVKVRVIIEHDPFDRRPVNVPAIRRLKAAGIQVRASHPRFRFTHAKAAILDGREALVLTANLTRSAFERNREYGVIVRDPAPVADLLAVFNADWDHKDLADGIIRRSPDLVLSPDNARTQITGLIAKAKRRLLVEVEFLKDPEISRLLGDSAKRGVDVRVVLPIPRHDGEDEVSEDDLAGAVKELAAAGVRRFRFLKKPYMHAKMIVADGTVAYVGSVNLTTNSLNRNREVGILVRDRALLKRLEAIAQADWERGLPLKDVDFLNDLPVVIEP